MVEITISIKVRVTATTFGGGSVDGYQPDMIITFLDL